jgi:predicted lysophospholipase L1 biosynthesis ABC-type transport system permease subunit
MGIGAGRGRLVRQLLIESLTLAAAASVLGLALAFWATPVLLRLLQTESDSLAVDVSLDWRQLGAAAVLCAITTLLFGLVPALRAARIKIDAVLKGSRSTGTSFGGVLMGRAMVSAQMALSLALLLTAALFLATLRNLAAVRAGFDRDHILIAQLNSPAPSTQQQRRVLWNEVHRRASSIAGVESAAFSNWPLFTTNTWGDPRSSGPGLIEPTVFRTQSVHNLIPPRRERRV